MNPFDLRGPEFLVFYLLLLAATLLAVVFLRRSRESGLLPPQELNDPYLYAFLAGGPGAAVNAATMALVDRGALKVEKKTLTISQDPALQTSPVQIEREVLDYFKRNFSTPRELLNLAPKLNSCVEYDNRLRRQKLLPDTAIKQERRSRVVKAVLLLLGVSIIKLFVAIARGHKNIGFLIILTVVGSLVAIVVGNPRRTTVGNDYLKNAQSLFSRLKGSPRRKDKPAGADLLWAAALFGVATVPQVQYLRDLGMIDTSSSGGGDSGGGGGCGGGGCGGCGG
ncbi:MAG: hypothetical protein DMG65_20795 [Candidatus Angelobacter sp. Gp1-AA117]|nr:MAG: hypothetical protein DMG65_20795 [Candidatus Angelobacter sp. Gp1-AA117]